jgi:hypothetical protein
LKGKKEMPKPLFSRKEKLAAWLTTRENPYFTRAVANRVWAQFMGRGIVHPVDDLGGKNTPSHPELLDTLTRELGAHQFDLKWYIRELLNSETYQLAGAGSATEAMPKWFERARVRPLSAEELLASIRTATAAEGKIGSDAGVYVTLYFGEPMDGQGEFQGGLSEHLFLNNSSHIRQMIQARKGNLADSVVTSKDPWEKRIDRMFLAVLSRTPTAEEQKRFAAHLTSGGKPETLVEEAIWVLLNCSEFRFNH